jgi:hypothetical protein
MPQGGVALHTGRVDWNMEVAEWWYYLEVATRTAARTGMLAIALPLAFPVRRAPTRGAWIETAIETRHPCPVMVAPHAGRVD